MCTSISILPFFFFFNDTATTEIYTLSLHDALPIFVQRPVPQQTLRHQPGDYHGDAQWLRAELRAVRRDRKSTRLNSSHGYISYAVFCLKKKNKQHTMSSDRAND